jgi:hypothetical protein
MRQLLLYSRNTADVQTCKFRINLDRI